MKNKKDFMERVLSYAKENKLWEKGSSILAAVSGGPDSMGLLLFLKEIEKSESLRIGCCTVQHHLRIEAEEETEYVRGVCAALSIPFYRRDVDVQGAMKRGEGSLETVARELRYEALRQVAAEAGYDAIAAAHHADDQAETILFHFLRGSGAKGLAGMSPRNDDVIRPFLSATKKEIEGFLGHFPYRYFHDATNEELTADRNKIRHLLLPELSKYSPQLTSHLLQMGEIFREEDAYLEDAARRWLTAHGGEGAGEIFISRKDFETLPVALARRVLRKAAVSISGETADFQGIERMRKLALSGESGAVTSAAGVVMEKGAQDLYFYEGNTKEGKGQRPLVRLYSHYVKFVKKQVDNTACADIIGYNNIGEEVCGPWRMVKEIRRPRVLAKNQCLLPLEIGQRVHLRLARKEDIMTPRGMTGEKSLFRLLQEAGISPSARPLWPIIADEKEVYWLGFLRGSARVSPAPAEDCLLITLSWVRKEFEP